MRKALRSAADLVGNLAERCERFGRRKAFARPQHPIAAGHPLFEKALDERRLANARLPADQSKMTAGLRQVRQKRFEHRQRLLPLEKMHMPSLSSRQIGLSD